MLAAGQEVQLVDEEAVDARRREVERQLDRGQRRHDRRAGRQVPARPAGAPRRMRRSPCRRHGHLDDSLRRERRSGSASAVTSGAGAGRAEKRGSLGRRGSGYASPRDGRARRGRRGRGVLARWGLLTLLATLLGLLNFSVALNAWRAEGVLRSAKYPLLWELTGIYSFLVLLPPAAGADPPLSAARTLLASPPARARAGLRAVLDLPHPADVGEPDRPLPSAGLGRLRLRRHALPLPDGGGQGADRLPRRPRGGGARRLRQARAGPRAASRAARAGAVRGAPDRAQDAAQPALPVQHPQHDRVAGARGAGARRGHDRPPRRLPAPHAAALAGAAGAARDGARVPRRLPGDHEGPLRGAPAGRAADRPGRGRGAGAAAAAPAARRERDHPRHGRPPAAGPAAARRRATRRDAAARRRGQRPRPRRRRSPASSAAASGSPTRPSACVISTEKTRRSRSRHRTAAACGSRSRCRTGARRRTRGAAP